MGPCKSSFNFNENYKSLTLKVGTRFLQAFIASIDPLALHSCTNICSMIVRDFDAINMTMMMMMMILMQSCALNLLTLHNEVYRVLR